MFRKNGRPSKDIRIALGALIIQQTLGVSDEETVQQIEENLYLQYFIGIKKYTNQRPFDPSLMVWFRKRLSAKFMAEINEIMCSEVAMPQVEEHKDNDDDNDDMPHGGTLILDATCTPADITYPTDTGLLGEAIEKTEELIDELHKPDVGEKHRPRTYRIKSRKVFSAMIKKRKPSAKIIRKCIGQQLGFLRRNLKFIDEMLSNGGKLSTRQLDLVEILRMLYEQQLEMYRTKCHSAENRIVSISQPHIRPIVRGKASAKVEFGAKIAVGVVNGYTYVDKFSFDNFNESTTLKDSIQNYYRRFGMLPKEILADTIYRNRENRSYCKENGIRLSGRPLGRPKKSAEIEYEHTEKRDTSRRNEVEGKFGTLKTSYGLSRIMARLPETSETVINVAILAMNLTKRLKSLLYLFSNSVFWTDFEQQLVA